MTILSGSSIGRYHILEQLGEGGMATVYKAFDTQLEREVAIKFIRPDKLGRESTEITIKRFQREAHLLAKLSHPNILALQDHGEYEGLLYLVTNFIPGGSLKKRLGKPVPWQEAMRLLLPIARALEYAHGKNVLHRDIKPSNILLPLDGPPILADFGIAKVLETTTQGNVTATTQTDSGAKTKTALGGMTQTDSPQLTRSDIGIGTPEYMAPEQGRGKGEKRSDIYSLGIVLYELVTGRIPFIADTPLAVLLMHITDPLPSPRKFVPDIPVEIERIIIKALAKRPEDRYQTMAAFAEVMEQKVRSHQQQLRLQASKLEKDGHWAEAIRVWHEVVALGPEDKQQIEARTEQIQRASALDSIYQEAKLALAQKVYEQAATLLRKIVAQDRNYKDAAELLARAVKMRQSRALQLEREERWDDAIRTWKQILSVEPDDRPIIEAEITRIERLRDLSGIYNKARQALAKKDEAQAVKLLKEIITRDETYRDALELLARLTARRRAAPKPIRQRMVWIAVGITALVLAIAAVFLAAYQAPPFPLAGTWRVVGNEGEITFDAVCGIGDTCGTFAFPTIPCSGTFTLIGEADGLYEFQAGNKRGSCGEGRNLFQRLEDGTLQHTYSGTYQGNLYESTGILTLVSPPQKTTLFALLWAALRSRLLNPGVEPLTPAVAADTPAPETEIAADEQQIRDFADPILAAIADREPDYQDDFSDPNSGWANEYISEGNEVGYRDGAYFISNMLTKNSDCTGAAIPTNEYSDFVLEVDGQIVTGENGQWVIVFRDDGAAHYGLDISPLGQLWFHKNLGYHVELPETTTVIPLFQSGEVFNRVTLVVKENQMAVYVNGGPVVILTDDSSSRGSIIFAVCNGYPLQVMFDNLKIWKINDTAPEHILLIPFPGIWGDDQNVRMTFDTICSVGEICGSFDIPNIPCAGTFTLVGEEDGLYEFLAGDMVGPCGEDLGYSDGKDFFRLLPNGSLEHTFTALYLGTPYESTGTLTLISGPTP